MEILDNNKWINVHLCWINVVPSVILLLAKEKVFGKN